MTEDFSTLKQQIVKDLSDLNDKSLITHSIVCDYNNLFEKYNNFRREAMMGMRHRENMLEDFSSDKSKMSQKDLEVKLESLKQDYQLLESKKNELSDSNSESLKKIVNLSEKNEKLQIKIQQLETENNSLKTQMILTAKQNSNKGGVIDSKAKFEYEKKIQQLSSENAALKNQSIQVQKIIGNLTKSSKEKDKEISELKKKNEEMEKKIRELEEKLKK